MATKHPFTLEQIMEYHNTGDVRPSIGAGRVMQIEGNQVMLVKHFATVAGRQSWYVHVAGDPITKLRTATILE